MQFIGIQMKVHGFSSSKEISMVWRLDRVMKKRYNTHPFLVGDSLYENITIPININFIFQVLA